MNLVTGRRDYSLRQAAIARMSPHPSPGDHDWDKKLRAWAYDLLLSSMSEEDSDRLRDTTDFQDIVEYAAKSLQELQAARAALETLTTEGTWTEIRSAVALWKASRG